MKIQNISSVLTVTAVLLSFAVFSPAAVSGENNYFPCTHSLQGKMNFVWTDEALSDAIQQVNREARAVETTEDLARYVAKRHEFLKIFWRDGVLLFRPSVTCYLVSLDVREGKSLKRLLTYVDNLRDRENDLLDRFHDFILDGKSAGAPIAMLYLANWGSVSGLQTYLPKMIFITRE